MNLKLTTIAFLASLAVTTLTAAPTDTLVNPDQVEYPQITTQPDDQLVHMDTGSAKFSVVAVNGPLTYQWLRNGTALPQQTNSTLIIQKPGVKDVALYSCNVAKGLELVPTRSAQLMVYTNWLDARGVDPVVVYATAITNSGTSSNCPGSYIGYVSYKKTIAQGWGWTPDTNNNNTVFTATDTNRTTTKVEYSGKSSDIGCAQTSTTVPNPPVSTAYRFTIYFTNSIPTNSYSIVLDGFNP